MRSAYGVGQDTILDGQGFVPGATVTVALANIRGFSSTAEVVFEITTDGDGKIVERDSSADFGSVHGTSSNYEVGCDATRASDKEDGRGGYSYGITYQLPSGGEDVTIRAAYGGAYGEVKVASTVVLSNTRFDGGGQQACQWSEGGLHWSGSDGTLYGVHPDDFHQLTCGGDRKPILTYAECVVAANAFDHACPAVSFGASIASSVADEDWAGTKGCHVQEHIEHAATQWGAASWQFNRNMDGAGGAVEAPELKWQDTYCDDNGNLEDHWDDGTLQTLEECSDMCLTYPNCQYFLFGIDSRTGLNRCTAQARCNSRRAYGFGGTTAIYARAVASGGVTDHHPICIFPAHTGFEPGMEVVVFDHATNDLCRVDHSIGETLLDVSVTNIRVVRTDGGTAEWDVSIPCVSDHDAGNLPRAGACNAGYLGGDTNSDTLAGCKASCTDDCKYVSFCPAGGEFCTGGHVNMCARYSSCPGSDQHSAPGLPHSSYTTYDIAMEDPAAQRGACGQTMRELFIQADIGATPAQSWDFSDNTEQHGMGWAFGR